MKTRSTNFGGSGGPRWLPQTEMGSSGCGSAYLFMAHFRFEMAGVGTFGAKCGGEGVRVCGVGVGGGCRSVTQAGRFRGR